MGNKYAIKIEGLTKFYGKSRGVLDLDLKVEPGDIFGFLGPNGAGKSTTIRSLLGLIKFQKGKASILGLDVIKDHNEIMRKVGYMPSEAMFASLVASFLLSKEEACHTCDFLNTLPLGRTKVFLQKYLALISLIVLFNGISIICYGIGFLILGEGVQEKEFWLYHMTQLVMHVEIGSICFMISAFSRKNLVGVGLGVAILLYAADIMCRIIPAIEGLKYITPFYYSNGADIFSSKNVTWDMFFIGILITITCVIIAFIQYNKKDLTS